MNTEQPKIDLNKFRLQNLEELKLVLPLLSEQYDSFTTRWNGEVSTKELIETIIAQFTPANYFFSARKNNKLLFFMAVYARHPMCKPGEAFIDYVHVDSSFRVYTQTLIKELLAYLKADGFHGVKGGTCRMTRSYHRWITKLGFKQSAILYKQEI